MFPQLRTELLRKGNVVALGRATESPVSIGAGYSVNFPGSDTRGMLTAGLIVDEGYIPTVGIEIIEGRNFTEDDFKKLAKDSVNSFILNETAMRELGIEPENAVGTQLRMNGRNGTVVGIARDFHFASMHEKIKPLVMFTEPDYSYYFVRLSPDKVQAGLQDLKEACAILTPHRPFDYKFLDEKYQALFENETKMGSVCTAFAGLAIVIACLGLLGLVAFAAAQKTKEIGIRKVLGASAPGIVLLITRDFTILVIAAIVLGIPLSYYLMENYWLVNFEYRTDIGAWPFVAAAIGCLVVSFGTASYQAIKASMVNPAHTLRNE